MFGKSVRVCIPNVLPDGTSINVVDAVRYYTRRIVVSDLERYTVEGVGRIYTDHDELWLPSVSTVLEMLPKPEKLKRWQQRTDDPESIMEYKQNRGTLIHYDCQQQLVDFDMWGPEEQAASEFIDAQPAPVQDRMERERAWAESAWEILTTVAGITPASLIDTETYVQNHTVGYAGQFDLLYQDQSTDETVLADIKTSKGVYNKFPIQLTAYRHAVPASVDRLAVLRMNPDREDWKISTSEDWERDDEQLWRRFRELRRELQDEHMETLLDTIKEKAQTDDAVAAPGNR